MRSRRRLRSGLCAIAAVALSGAACSPANDEVISLDDTIPFASTSSAGVTAAASDVAPVDSSDSPPPVVPPVGSTSIPTTAAGATPSLSAPGTPAPGTPATTAAPAIPTTTLTPDCVGLADASSGSRVFTGADGAQRTYQLSVARLYDGTRATPLIVNLHAQAGNGLQHESNTLMGKRGNLRGYVVVTPDSTVSPPTWNHRSAAGRPDDFAFIHGVVAELQTTMCIDATRIHVAGHSNGGMFAAALACTAPFEFTAVAIVAAVPLASCPADVQPHVMEILGTADDITLYEGTPRRPGAHESIAHWANHAGCVGPPVEVGVADGVVERLYEDCPGADVMLLTIIDGAHPWPGGVVATNREGNSEAGRGFPATSTVLDFFDAHTR